MGILVEVRQGKLFFYARLDDGSEVGDFAPEGLGRVLGAIRNALQRRVVQSHFEENCREYERAMHNLRLRIDSERRLSISVANTDDEILFETSNPERLLEFIKSRTEILRPSDTKHDP
jgi:hypothetical protein